VRLNQSLEIYLH